MDDNAPQFFCSWLGGVAVEGPNLVLSFVTPIPSPDASSRKYLTNVRVVMSIESTKQMAAFLNERLSLSAIEQPMQMPPIQGLPH